MDESTCQSKKKKEPRRSRSPIQINEDELNNLVEEELMQVELSLNADQSDKGNTSFIRGLLRYEIYQRKRTELENRVLVSQITDLRNKVDQIQSENKILEMKLIIRPSLEQLQRFVIPPWVFNNQDISFEMKWIISIYFRLTIFAAVLKCRINKSSITLEILAEALVSLYFKSWKKIHHDPDPRKIILEEEEWNIVFKDINMPSELHNEAVKLALEPTQKSEIRTIEMDKPEKCNQNYLLYMDCITQQCSK